MVVLFRDALILHRIVRSGELGFQCPDAGDLGGRFFLRIAGQLEELLHMLLRGFADHHVLRILGGVVFLVAEGQTALDDGDDVVVRILLVGVDIHAEEEVVMLLGAVLQERFAAVKGVNLGEVGFQRRGAFGIQASRVHGHVVEVADLLCDTALFIVLGCNLLDQAGQGLGVLFSEFRESAPGRILRRLRVEVAPVTGGVLRKIVARTGGGVHVVVVEAGRLGRLGAAGGYDEPGSGQEKQHFFHAI